MCLSTPAYFLRISVVCFCPLVCSHASYSMFEYTIFFLACSRLVLVLLFTLSPFLGWGGGAASQRWARMLLHVEGRCGSGGCGRGGVTVSEHFFYFCLSLFFNFFEHG